MAAIVGLPAGGSLVAATNYYQRCISSTSSSLISSPTGMTPLTEEAQHKAGVLGVVTNSQITCVSWEMAVVVFSAVTQNCKSLKWVLTSPVMWFGTLK
uniref:Uncharacterized protein n=1 Tax=Astatotilapia calliptera TaxID=8154 RepID=A0A3P8QA49_ASTCA